MISKLKRQIHANVCYMEFGHFRIKSDFEFAKLGLFFNYFYYNLPIRTNLIPRTPINHKQLEMLKLTVTLYQH